MGQKLQSFQKLDYHDKSHCLQKDKNISWIFHDSKAKIQIQLMTKTYLEKRFNLNFRAKMRLFSIFQHCNEWCRLSIVIVIKADNTLSWKKCQKESFQKMYVKKSVTSQCVIFWFVRPEKFHWDFKLHTRLKVQFLSKNQFAFSCKNATLRL